MKIDVDFESCRPLLDEVGERAQQPEIVERRRAQFQSKVVNLFSNGFGHDLERCQRGFRWRVGALFFQRFETEKQRGDVLADLIVELARNSSSLLFLSAGQLSLEFLPGGLGALPFDDLIA